MRVRKSALAPLVAGGVAVLALAGTVLVSAGVAEALLLIVVVAVLAGMYMLRRYARARLLYDRRAESHHDGEPAGGMAAADREDAIRATH